MKDSSFDDIDYVLTTRELGDMIKQAGINFINLPDSTPDPLLGEGTGAAVIFGATGGVMEAALRTVADILTGDDLAGIDYNVVRGIEGVKTASVTLPIDGKDTEIKVAVAHGTKNAAKVLDAVRAGELDVHFIEVMACPGGCVHGGGQPFVCAKTESTSIQKSIEQMLFIRKICGFLKENLIKTLKLKRFTKISSANRMAIFRTNFCILIMRSVRLM